MAELGRRLLLSTWQKFMLCKEETAGCVWESETMHFLFIVISDFTGIILWSDTSGDKRDCFSAKSKRDGPKEIRLSLFFVIVADRAFSVYNYNVF